MINERRRWLNATLRKLIPGDYSRICSTECIHSPHRLAQDEMGRRGDPSNAASFFYLFILNRRLNVRRFTISARKAISTLAKTFTILV